VELCRRDEIIAVRDEAQRAMSRGDSQAGYVVAWMDQLLHQRQSAAIPITIPENTMADQLRR